ncbi:hypothetical protein FHS22_002320 [Planomonospora venezuelensis]|uniref:Uncharacterized protein n=1 Tax=Planomonospora venezuelensis TaxID=1999 RepID=A0A841D6G6_PLAVE|nr:hypothetical protein [Planomonospora venezuelensis]
MTTALLSPPVPSGESTLAVCSPGRENEEVHRDGVAGAAE